MASFDVVTTHEGRQLFYNVDSAVGVNCPNEQSDVLLVQFFLAEVFKLTRASVALAGVTSRNIAPMGIWTDSWSAYLRAFQKTAAQVGLSIKQDGRADPVLGGRTRGSISHMGYTILYLNLVYPADLADLPEVCPPGLRSKLKLKFAGGYVPAARDYLQINLEQIIQ